MKTSIKVHGHEIPVYNAYKRIQSVTRLNDQ